MKKRITFLPALILLTAVVCITLTGVSCAKDESVEQETITAEASAPSNAATSTNEAAESSEATDLEALKEEDPEAYNQAIFDALNSFGKQEYDGPLNALMGM